MKESQYHTKESQCTQSLYYQYQNERGKPKSSVSKNREGEIPQEGPNVEGHFR